MATKIVQFKRGSTFSYVLNVPPSIPDGLLTNWFLKAQARKEKTDTLLADLSAFWVDKTARQVVIYHNLTSNWPLGNMEVDIKFTSPEGQSLSSATLTFQVVREITK